MISIKNLTKYYGDVCAVDDLTFEIDKGQIIGLLGPNGAGKTTTMRILTGYLKPTSGTISVEDFDVGEDPVDVKRRIGYLPESAPIYPDMLTYDYLDFVASIHGLTVPQRRARIVELAALCGIAEVMHKPVKELSRGYKQRVGLAHAMMSDPEILVLDEPTAGLDPNQIVQIRSIIRKMGEKKTVVFSTHILSEAEATCDRIVIINRGRIVADGTPKTLGAAGLQSQLVRLVITGATFEELSAGLGALDGVSSVMLSDDKAEPEAESAVAVTVACDGDRRESMYREIKKRDWIILELTKERQSLEATFRELTLDSDSQEEKI